MGEKRIVDLFNIKARFLRSAQLERDFHDASAFTGYVLTGFTRSCLERVAGGLRPGSGQRAWRMTGDYGSGKSSFALLLAHWFAGNDSVFPLQIRKVIDFHHFGVRSPQFVPVLVTCSRQPLGISILRALHRALVENYGRGQKSKIAVEVQRLLDDKQAPTEEQVLEAILEVNARIITDSKGKGLMLILDELGKFLEFAALHTQRQDVFLLQRLAETASRSGDEPLFVVCLLHQGFNAYAEYLDHSAQREWEKVAGRFDEIVFDQPIEQIAGLIASALNINTEQLPRALAAEQKQAMERTIHLGWFGSAPTRDLHDLAAPLFPLHPTVLPVLIRAFRRFGQNERSLFSFLLSNEPSGLLAFSTERIEEAEPYRLDNFYDYVRTNFGHRLNVQSYRSHWNLIDSLVESFSTKNPLQIKVLKTVGILNLLDDGDLIPTEDAIVCAVADENPMQQKQVRASLEKLRTGKRVLYDRGRARGLCLWPHTSVDLEKAYEEARRATDTPQRVANLIKDYLETRPIVARRHYIKTGNLRHYDVRYCSVSEMDAVVKNYTTDSDGTIVIPLCETEQERDAALAMFLITAGEEHQLRNLKAQSDVRFGKDNYKTTTNSPQDTERLENACQHGIGRASFRVGKPICLVGQRRVLCCRRDVPRLHRAQASSHRVCTARPARQEPRLQVSAQRALSCGYFARTGESSTLNRSFTQVLYACEETCQSRWTRHQNNHSLGTSVPDFLQQQEATVRRQRRWHP
jgi:hypothetical protein